MYMIETNISVCIKIPCDKYEISIAGGTIRIYDGDLNVTHSPDFFGPGEDPLANGENLLSALSRISVLS